jgi:hypothetical protein
MFLIKCSGCQEDIKEGAYVIVSSKGGFYHAKTPLQSFNKDYSENRFDHRR